MGRSLINTSEAYSRFFFVGDKNVVVPYININLLPNNPINEESVFIEYSYYVFKDVRFAQFFGSENIHFDFINSKDKDGVIQEVYIGLDGIGRSNGAEIKICCYEHSLFIPIESRISNVSTSFIPRDTPVFNMNMNVAEVQRFFSKKKIPDALNSYLGERFYSILLG